MYRFSISQFITAARKAFKGGANGGSQNRTARTGKQYKKGGRITFDKRTDYADFAFSQNPNPYIEAVLKEIVHNSVGGAGIAVSPQPLNANGQVNTKLQKKLEKLWRENKDRLDAGGRHKWAELNKMIARDLFGGGEVFLIKKEDSRIKNSLDFGFMIKGYSAVPFDNTKGYYDGIKCDDLGIPQSYLFANEQNYKAVNARSVIHAACFHNSDDTRGFSQIAPACDLAVEIDMYDKESSKLVAASKKVAFWVVSENKPNFPAGMPVIHVQGKPKDTDVKALSSNLANAYSKEHRKNLHRSMCAAVRTGYGAVSGEFDGSYSASRQEMIVAAQGDLDRQTKIIDDAITPIYEAFVIRCLQRGLIRDITDGDIFNARYVAPRREHIDPLKQAKAVATELATNQITLSDVLAQKGKDFDLHLIHLKDELQKLKDAGLQPNGIEALKWLELNVKDEGETPTKDEE